MRKSVWKILVVSIVVISIFLVLLSIWKKPIESHPFFIPDNVRVMAHRGGRKLWPENTVTAFGGAVALGVDVLEMDVHGTKDGAIVVLHDDTVDRTTDGEGFVRNFLVSEIKALDAGYRWSPDNGITYPYRDQGILMPTLEEVLKAFPKSYYNIEIKQSQPPIVTKVCEMLRDHDATERVLVASFNPDTIQAFREACPEVATAASEDEVRILFFLSLLHLEGIYSPKAEALQVPEYFGRIHLVTRRFVNAAHRCGMEVHVWTVNDLDDMRRLLDLNVDGIITDAPDLLLELLGG